MQLTIRNQCPTKSLRVMVLENRNRLLALPDRRILPRLCLLEVNHQRQALLAWGHEVDHALEHEDQMLNLAIALFGVLSGWHEVETWSPIDVISENDLFSSFVLR